MSGYGDCNDKGEMPGDLIITVELKPDNYF